MPDLNDSITCLNPQRICVIKPSAFGDVVQTIPLLPVLCDRFPEARISWVVKSGLQDLLTGHPLLEEVIPFERILSVRHSLQLARELRSRRFDLVLDLQGLLRTGAMSFATRAPLRIGMETAREGAHWFCHETVPQTGSMLPVHQRLSKVAEYLGCEQPGTHAEIDITSADREWADKLTGEFGTPAIAIHAGARWVTKRWPVEKFAAVAGRAMREFQRPAVLLGSHDEQTHSAQLRELLRQLYPAGQVIDLTGKTTIKQLAAILPKMATLLTNDTGPMHLAAALGVPVVGVFTCTSPVRSGPPGDQHELVSTNVGCAASYKKRCPHYGEFHQACFDELSSARVAAAMYRLLDRQTRTSDAA